MFVTKPRINLENLENSQNVLRSVYEFPMDFPWFSHGFPWIPHGSHVFPMDFPWIRQFQVIVPLTWDCGRPYTRISGQIHNNNYISGLFLVYSRNLFAPGRKIGKHFCTSRHSSVNNALPQLRRKWKPIDSTWAFDGRCYQKLSEGCFLQGMSRPSVGSRKLFLLKNQ